MIERAGGKAIQLLSEPRLAENLATACEKTKELCCYCITPDSQASQQMLNDDAAMIEDACASKNIRLVKDTVVLRCVRDIHYIPIYYDLVTDFTTHRP
eukprot:SAG31_NODE_2707_length_5211_cov_7.051601_3_plen_98_part_00